MKKLEIGDKFTRYEDGSFDVLCNNCGKQEHLEPDSKIAIRYLQIPTNTKKHLCLDCWKLGQDKIKQFQKDQREDDIHWGQAYNLAFQFIITDRELARRLPLDNVLEEIPKYQRQIYNHIKSLKGRQNNKANEN